MKYFNFMTSIGICLLILLLVLPKASSTFNPDDDRGDPVRVFTGYDTKAPIGHHVWEQSIMEHSTRPIAITPLYLTTLQKSFYRERSPDQLTDFSYSRFIVPYLCNYKGWALFVDGNDMMLRKDISKLWALRDDRFAVMVVKHPAELFEGKEHSFSGKSIKSYPMFNWSSVMLFNNEKCQGLTKEYVNTAAYYDLHQFKWLKDEALIGELPSTWNHLVGYYKPNPKASLVHWTLGAPYQGGEFAKAEHAEKWYELYKAVTNLPKF
jgi:hypothetical protein